MTHATSPDTGSKHTFGYLHRHTQRCPLPPPLVEQSVIAELLKPFTHPPHRPVADPDDLGRLQPGDFFAMAFKITSCTFHHPLQFRGRDRLACFQTLAS